jgi:cytochrome c oxidase subunit 2
MNAASLRRSLVRGGAFFLAGFSLACSGFQSALDPKGPKAAAIFHLDWFLVITAAVVYVIVIGALLFALRRATTRPVAFARDDT